MTQAEVDLMSLDRSRALDRAYHDPDGDDWRSDPHDDRAVLDALRPDPEPDPARERLGGPVPQRARAPSAA
jgi:hypothetical protein